MSGLAQWWPARTQTFSSLKIAEMSCGWTPLIVKEIMPVEFFALKIWIDLYLEKSFFAWERSFFSWASIFFSPIFWRNFKADSKATTSAIFGVPASNFHGDSSKLAFV